MEAVAAKQDVREWLKQFIFEDKVHFAKAAQVLRGGKTTERVKSETRVVDSETLEPFPNAVQKVAVDAKKKFKAKMGRLNGDFLKKWAESNMALNFQQFSMLNQYANNSGKKRKKQSKIFKYAESRPKRGHSMTARGKSPRKANLSEDMFRPK